MILSKRAQKDLEELVREGHREKVTVMLQRMEVDPFYPPYEKLSLNLSGKYSRRITIRDRLVYEISTRRSSRSERYGKTLRWG